MCVRGQSGVQMCLCAVCCGLKWCVCVHVWPAGCMLTHYFDTKVTNLALTAVGQLAVTVAAGQLAAAVAVGQ